MDPSRCCGRDLTVMSRAIFVKKTAQGLGSDSFVPSQHMKHVFFLILAGVVTGEVSIGAATRGGLLHERWTQAPGAGVGDLLRHPNYPANPTTVEWMPTFELAPRYVGNVGNRLWGAIVPPVTGAYRFTIASTHTSELWLNTNGIIGGKTRIALVPSYTEPREWTKFPEQRSVWIQLEAGQSYAIEALHKVAGCCGDHLAVAWEGPGVPLGVIQGASLALASFPPTVQLIAPTNGASHEDHDNITLTAMASDRDGTITKIQFYVEGAFAKLLGEIHTNAGSLVWSNATPGTHRLFAKAFDNDGVAGSSELVTIAVGGTNPGSGALLREAWTGLPGQRVADLQQHPSFPLSPATRELVTTLAFGDTYQNQRAERLRGYLHPPRDGAYRFYVAGTHECQILLGTNDAAAGRRLIATVGGEASFYTDARDWWKSSQQESAPVFLNAGGKYYFEVLHKVGDCCGDSLAVAWDVPGGPFEIIPARSLSPLLVLGPDDLTVPATAGTCSAAVSFETATLLSNATIICEPPSGAVFPVGTASVLCVATNLAGESAAVAFQVTVTDAEPPTLQCPPSVLGATSREALLPVSFSVSATDNCDPAPSITCTPASGSLFPLGSTRVTCVAQDAAGNTASCRFSVFRARPSDERFGSAPVAPGFHVLEAQTRGHPFGVTVTFSAPVDALMATNPANYSIAPDVLVQSVTWIEEAKVRLHTSLMTEGNAYTLAVSNVADRSVPANTVAPASVAFVQTHGAIARKQFDIPYDGFITPTLLAALTNNPFTPKYPDLPDTVSFTTQLETPTDAGANYGVQFEGYLTAPVTGDYVFYLNSDDQGALFLSSDEIPANKQLIATEPEWNAPRNWVVTDRRPNGENISAPIPLAAGRRYYVEALMKENLSGDNLAVAWRKPGDPPLTNGAPPIAGAFLSTRWPVEPAAIEEQPSSATVAEGGSVTFRVALGGTPPHDFQWFRDGQPIGGANAATFTLANVLPSDRGAVFHVLAGNGLTNMRSADAVLTVSADTTPPALLSATGHHSMTRVVLTFSERVNTSDAADVAHYSISGGLMVSAAVLQSDGVTVWLTTTPQTPGSNYVVSVTDLRDVSAAQNVMAPGSQISFTAFVLLTGGLREETYLGICCSVLPDLLNDPRFPDRPDRTGFVTAFEALSNAGDQYGTRLSGFLLPPTTGDYRFFLSAFSDGALYLSTDESPTNRQLIATDPCCSAVEREPRDWLGMTGRDTNAPQNRSALISLESGRRYYVEALLKAGAGADNLGVAWQLPGGPEPQPGSAPIPGTFLATFAEATGVDVTITLPPQDATVPEGAPVSFVVRVEANTPFVSYQWQRDGTNLANATANEFKIASTSLGDDGAKFRCIVSVPGNTVASAEATLSVTSNAPAPLPAGFERVTVTTRSGPVTLVVPRRQFVFTPAGNTCFIATNGSDANPGTMVEPWRTFAHAIAQVQPGDLVYARAGDYPEPFVIRKSGLHGKPIIFSSYPGERVHIFPPPGWEPAPGTTHGANTIQIDGSYIWIHGFEIMGPPRELGYRPLGTPVLNAIQLGGASVGCRLLNNVCYKAQASGIKDQTGAYDYLVEGNICFDNATPLDAAYPYGAGMYLPSPSAKVGTIVRGNASFRNGAGGISHFHRPTRQFVYNNAVFDNATEALSYGLETSGASNTYAHNVIVRNNGWGFSLYAAEGEGQANDNVMLNSIVADNTFSQLDKTFDPPNGNRIDFGLLFPAANAIQPLGRFEGVLGENLLFVDALFQDSASNDFRLQPGSPARGAAGPVMMLGAFAPADLGLFSATNYWEPELEPIADVTVAEGEEIRFAARLVNSNLPATIRFSLAEWAPEQVPANLNESPYSLETIAAHWAPRGARIDPVSGEFSWTHDDAQGPASYRITIVATADESPILAGARTFTVTVNESNRAPAVGLSASRQRMVFDGSLDLFARGARTAPGTTVAGQDDTVTVISYGGGIIGPTATDDLRFDYQVLEGDFDARVRVTSLTVPGDQTWAGLMVRESLAPDSRMFAAIVYPKGPSAVPGYPGRDGYQVMARWRTGDPILPTIGISPDAPFPNAWVRLQRSADTFIGYRSDDGVRWTELYRVTPSNAFPARVFAGLSTRAARWETNECAVATYAGYTATSTEAGPVNDRVLAEGSALELQFHASDPDTPAQTLRFSLSDDAPAPASIDSWTGRFSFIADEGSGGMSFPIAVTVVDSGTPPRSNSVTFAITVTELNSAPFFVGFEQRELTGLDIGGPVSAGSTEMLPDGTIVVTAGGSDIWNSQDSFHFSHELVSGDFDVRVQVESLQPVNRGSKAGLMVRESLAPGSRAVHALVLPAGPAEDGSGEGANQYEAAYRNEPDGPTVEWPGGAVSPAPTFSNAWVRLTRSNQWFHAWRSSDGVTWLQFASLDLTATPFARDVFLGLATTSHNNSPGRTTVARYHHYGGTDEPVLFEASEGELFLLPLAAADADLPPQQLTFSIAEGPATIPPATGLLSWTPAETDGGSNHLLRVVVSDDGSPSLSRTQRLNISVREVNRAPALVLPGEITIDELAPFTAAAMATDGDLPAQTLTFGLVSGPGGLSVSGAGAISWTPSESQGPSTNNVAVRVFDSGAPSLSATQSFTIIVREVNRAPSLALPVDQVIDELAPFAMAASASDPDVPAQGLTFALVSGPAGLDVSGDGAITWTPGEPQGPSTNEVVVRVFDNGAPSLSTTQSFTIVVREVNSAPGLSVPADQALDEMLPFTAFASASDGDVPAQLLAFSLVSGPAGLGVSSAGTITWTPTEAQGPGTNTIVVRVVDNGAPALSATQSLILTVREVNAAPVLGPISNFAVNAGVIVSFVPSVSDPDVPENQLVFGLATNGASGATLNTTNGAFMWRPPVARHGTTNTFAIVVSDDGAPSLSATQQFRVTVNALGPVRLHPALSAGDVIEILVEGDTGPDYTIESSWNLIDWTSLLTTNAPALPFTFAEPRHPTNRFYRVRLEP